MPGSGLNQDTTLADVSSFLQFLQADVRTVFQIIPKLLPFTSIPIHFTVIVRRYVIGISDSVVMQTKLCNIPT
jgi:hypothetical protein